MQLAFFFDQSKCSGCLTCVMACRQWHGPEREAANWRRVETIEKGVYPDLRVSFLSLSCLHCQSPPCLAACPTAAIRKGEQDGIVLVDQGKCLGEPDCGHCGQACPYGMPRFPAGEDFRMGKCDFCRDRLAQDKRPLCVEACPMQALDAGPQDRLAQRYGRDTGAEGFSYSEKARPSVLMRKKR